MWYFTCLFLCPTWVFYVQDECLFLCPTWYSYVQDESTKCMPYPTLYFYDQDGSTKCLIYVIFHLFIFMSNMIFLCPGWIYEMLAKCKIAFIYFHVRHMRKIDLSAYAQDEYGRWMKISVDELLRKKNGQTHVHRNWHVRNWQRAVI